jgi:hypothetical protein
MSRRTREREREEKKNRMIIIIIRACLVLCQGIIGADFIDVCSFICRQLNKLDEY